PAKAYTRRALLEKGRARVADFARLDEVRRSQELLVQAMNVVGVVDAEGRLDDGQLHDELDAGGTPQAKIGSPSDAQLAEELARIASVRKSVVEIDKPARIELQTALFDDARRAAVEEQHGLHGTDKWNAIFGVTVALQVAARKRQRIAEDVSRR